MNEQVKMTIGMPINEDSFGAYEINLLSMVIEVVFNLSRGNHSDGAPRVLRLAADMIEEECC